MYQRTHTLSHTYEYLYINARTRSLTPTNTYVSTHAHALTNRHGQTIFTGGLDGRIRRWEARLEEGGKHDYTCVATHDLGAAVLCLQLDAPRKRLLAGTADGFAVAIEAWCRVE